MSISQDDVRKIAKLSRIRLNEEQVEHFQGELSNILDWIETLQEVDTQNVAPMASIVVNELPLRDDEVTDGDNQDGVLANAPKSDYGCFIVPKVVE